MISIIITSKNEPYLERTIADLKDKAEGEIEILAEEDDGRGQRAMLNKLASQAKYPYVMKSDAHCLFSRGYDTELLARIEENVILAPRLLVLDEETWIPKNKTASSYCFDENFVQGYCPEDTHPVNETMCLQGSCYVVSAKNYFDWNLNEEALGSWGGMGAELGIKAHLNGGKCKTDKLAYYAHLFRTLPEDFPYQRSEKEILKNQKKFIKKYKNRTIANLIRKFDYPCGWTEKKLQELP